MSNTPLPSCNDDNEGDDEKEEDDDEEEDGRRGCAGRPSMVSKYVSEGRW